MREISFIVVLSCFFMMFGCDVPLPNHEKGNAIARVYDKYLYESDLSAVVYPGITKLDSIARVAAYIDAWVRREILLYQAEKNLNEQDLDFSKRLEEYKNSLVLYTYETQLVEQKLDTVVSDEEIESYYEENKDNFQLRYNLVKVAYVVVDEQNGAKKNLRDLLKNQDTLLINDFDNLAQEHALSYFSDVDHWMRLDDLLEVIPLEIFNTESFLRRNKFVSFDKDNYTYMVRFDDYLLEESVSPIELERQKIRNVILMKRKKLLLNQMNIDLYEKAIREGAFDIY